MPEGTSRRVAPVYFYVSALTGTASAWLLILVSGEIGSIIRPASVTWLFQGWRFSYGVAHFFFYLGLGGLIGSWLLLGIVARRGGLTHTRGLLALTSWGLPFVLGVPLFGRDIYSYIAQGLLVQRGFDPYVASPSLLSHHSAIYESVAVVWRNTSSPYGPLWVVLTKGTVAAAGHGIVAQIFAFRLLAVASLALLLWASLKIARQRGTSTGVVWWLVGLNPLVLASVLSSAHNDVLMMALVAVALWCYERGGTVWATTLFALASCVKLPALAGVALVALSSVPSPRQRLQRLAGYSSLAVFLMALVSVATGYGFGWLSPHALQIPTMLHIITTPSVCVGVFIAATFHTFGWAVATHAVVSVVQPLVSLVGLAYIVSLVRGVSPSTLTIRLGLVLLSVVVTSPTTWPWYYLWGLVILATTSLQGLRLLPVISILALVSVGPGGTPMLGGNGFVVVAPLLVWYAWRAWRRGTLASWRNAS